MINAIVEERVYLGCTVSDREYMDIMVRSVAAGRLTSCWNSSWELPSDPQTWYRDSKQDGELQSPPNVTPPPRPHLLVLPSWVPPIEDWVFKCLSLWGHSHSILCRVQRMQGVILYCIYWTLVVKDLRQNLIVSNLDGQNTQHRYWCHSAEFKKI